MDKTTVKKEILEWAKYLTGAVIFALIIQYGVIVNAQVVSPSMEGTIMTNSRIFGYRLSYVFSEPERFDIIIFRFPDNEASDPFVKRIIGLPSEKIEIRDGKVYVNDSDIPLNDSFVNGEVKGNFGPYTVPENHYFVLGDNRNRSHDSKDWINTFVSKDKIMGKVFAEYFPSPGFMDKINEN
jgi:signal peptidase I